MEKPYRTQSRSVQKKTRSMSWTAHRFNARKSWWIRGKTHFFLISSAVSLSLLDILSFFACTQANRSANGFYGREIWTRSPSTRGGSVFAFVLITYYIFTWNKSPIAVLVLAHTTWRRYMYGGNCLDASQVARFAHCSALSTAEY